VGEVPKRARCYVRGGNLKKKIKNGEKEYENMTDSPTGKGKRKLTRPLQ